MIECKLHAAPGGALLDGELTITTVTDVRLKLLELLAGTAPLVLDLSGISSIDMAGLQVLVSFRKSGRRMGRALKFANHSEPVLRILDLTGLAGALADKIIVPHGRRAEFPFRYGLERKEL